MTPTFVKSYLCTRALHHRAQWTSCTHHIELLATLISEICPISNVTRVRVGKVPHERAASHLQTYWVNQLLWTHYSDISWPLTLASCPSANNIQAVYHCLQVSTWGSSVLSDRNVCSGCCQHWPSLSSFSSMWRSDGAKNENDSVWIKEFCSLWTKCLNGLPPTLRSSSTTLGQFQSRLKTTLFHLAYGMWLGAFTFRPLQLAPYKCSNLLTYRRLRWLADVLHTDDIRLSRQVVYWESNSTKWKPEKPRKYWTDTIHQDLKEFAWLGHNSIGVWPSVSLTWDELSSRALVALKKFSAGSQLGYCNF